MTKGASTNSKLQAIRWEHPRLLILNQLLLPHASEYVEIRNSEDGHRAIATMQVRGAPAIAIVAALSLAAEVLALCNNNDNSNNESVAELICSKLDYLGTSRPTAVDLFKAIASLKATVADALQKEEEVDIGQTYVDNAVAMLDRDVAANNRIGENGAEFIKTQSEKEDCSSNGGGEGVKVLTHCNTGALATAGHGTALGIIRSMYHKGIGNLEHVYFTETRPYNQGARLTSYELLTEGIPSTLVCDSAVSALLQSDPSIVAIVVGADRVAANGDTANKIGTYQLAITARHHGRLFIVAAPWTSIDLSLPSGKGIVIEKREENEITTITGFTQKSILAETSNSGSSSSGAAVDQLQMECIQVAPLGARAWNPSFDVTPASLISAIVTETGVFTKPDGAAEYDLQGAFGS
ncbi:S-methyl-5-thioribose-1-phosphate isomerase [Coemansia sp. BCRC 34490]|nr:S-methyl-5-thioribose-1-phosphate isomerase [Coemansia sp. BCRC 34490]